MYKLVVFAALLALAAAAPAPGHLVASAPLAYGAPLAYAAPAVAYAAHVPAATIGHVAVGAPISYVSGHSVAYSVEPVEQHGYRIAY